MLELREVAKGLMEKVIQDPAVETAWLSTLAHMERIAARQIRTNISAFTPQEEKESILEHAADEDRHAEMILAMKPLADLPSQRYQTLQEKFFQIAEHFVVGYFGNPLLITAKNKHAAYAHGAVTIEQFPFQVYTAYLKATQLESVKHALPDVIRDEQGHIQLGKRLLSKLPAEEQLSIERLYEIEEDMCARMMQRMTLVLDRFYSENEASAEHKSSKSVSLEALVASTVPTTIAWTYALAFGEKLGAETMKKVFDVRGLEYPEILPQHMADEMRHCKMLQRTVLIDRRKLMRDPAYVKMEEAMLRAMKHYQGRLFANAMRRAPQPDLMYYYSSLALETRVFRHYKEYMGETDHSGIGHVLGAILDDEMDHTRQVSTAIKGAPENDTEVYREISQLERALWSELTEKVESVVGEFLASNHSVVSHAPNVQEAYA